MENEQLLLTLVSSATCYKAITRAHKLCVLTGSQQWKYCIIHRMEEKIVSTIVKNCKEVLSRYYGSRLKGVILYGSMARGEADLASDIDLLVLLSAPFDYFGEMRQIVDLLYPIQLESEQLISAKPALASDYEVGALSLYRNVRREGVTV